MFRLVALPGIDSSGPRALQHRIHLAQVGADVAAVIRAKVAAGLLPRERPDLWTGALFWQKIP